MSRLQSELQRLYGRPVDGVATVGVDRAATVRAMVLELARPADWDLLSKAWRGVQADLELPAPAIAGILASVQISGSPACATPPRQRAAVFGPWHRPGMQSGRLWPGISDRTIYPVYLILSMTGY